MPDFHWSLTSGYVALAWWGLFLGGVVWLLLKLEKDGWL